MTKDKCAWHAEGIWTEGLCHCSGCSCELFEATQICREAMLFLADAIAMEDLVIDRYMEWFEEKKREEWRKSGGVGAES